MINGLVGPSTKQGTQNGNRRPWRETSGIQIGGKMQRDLWPAANF